MDLHDPDKQYNHKYAESEIALVKSKYYVMYGIGT